MSGKYKVAQEVAEQEFVRLCETHRVDLDDMDDAEQETFADLRKRIVKAMMRGHLVVDDEGLAVYTPPVAGASPLRFLRVTAKELISTGRQKDDMGKTVDLIAAITKRSPAEIGRLDIADVRICGNLVTLFLASA